MAALIPRSSFQAAKLQSAVLSSSAVTVTPPNRNYSERPRIIKNPTTANLKRGTGGRSSFNGLVCTVFGASGFIGKHVVNRLGRSGTQIIIPYRGDHYEVAPLKVCGDLGQVLFHPFDLRDEDSILKCIKYSNVVINCIGCDWETKNFTYDEVHVEGAARLAKICKQNGVDKFIHLSCLNASPEPKPIILEGGSRFYKSKWEGEWAVKKEFPDATIIRPSDVYGTDDRFIRLYSHRWRHHFRGIALINKGENIEKQPIWVGDVAAGICAAAKDYKCAGRTYQFIGPNRYRLSDIIEYMFPLLRHDHVDFAHRRTDLKYYPTFLLKVKLTEAVSPAYPLGLLHMEGLEKEHTSDVVLKGVPTIEDLGITPIPINAQFAWETKPYRYDASYEASTDEFPDPEYPKPIPSVTV